MRLARVRTGHSLKYKIILSIIRFTSKREPPDVIKTLFYRPAHFGKPFSALVQASLRRQSEWTVGELELFAAYTSKLNQCVF